MSISFSETSIGLDISDSAIRVVKLNKKGKKNILSYFNDTKLAPGILVNGEIKKEKEFITALSKLAKEAKIKKDPTQQLITVLPESKTFIKVIDIPTAKTETDDKDKKEQDSLETLVKEELVNHIPLGLDEIYIDWQVIKRTPGSTRVLIGAVPKDVSNKLYETMEKAGLTPHVFEIEGAPIVRSLMNQTVEKNKKQPEVKEASTIIIDFGAARTGLIIYNQKTINFTVSLPISGDEITQTIAKTLNIDLKKAEEAKIICGLDKEKCEGALLKVLMDPIDKLASHIEKSILFYQDNFPNSPEIKEVILCGGGANFKKIDEVLSEKVGLTVKIGNPLEKIKQSKRKSIPSEKVLSYTTAIGLALKPFDK